MVESGNLREQIMWQVWMNAIDEIEVSVDHKIEERVKAEISFHLLTIDDVWMNVREQLSENSEED